MLIWRVASIHRTAYEYIACSLLVQITLIDGTNATLKEKFRISCFMPLIRGVGVINKVLSDRFPSQRRSAIKSNHLLVTVSMHKFIDLKNQKMSQGLLINGYPE